MARVNSMSETDLSCSECDGEAAVDTGPAYF